MQPLRRSTQEKGVQRTAETAFLQVRRGSRQGCCCRHGREPPPLLRFVCKRFAPFYLLRSCSPCAHPKRCGGGLPTRFALAKRQGSFPCGTPPLPLASGKRGGPLRPRGVGVALGNWAHLARPAPLGLPPPPFVFRPAPRGSARNKSAPCSWRHQVTAAPRLPRSAAGTPSPRLGGRKGERLRRSLCASAAPPLCLFSMMSLWLRLQYFALSLPLLDIIVVSLYCSMS